MMSRSGGKRERKPYIQIEVSANTSDSERAVLHAWIKKCWISPLTKTGSKWLGMDPVPYKTP